MLGDELQPLTLARVSREAGVDPFTAVRLLVASQTMPNDVLQFPRDTAATLREFGQIEEPWWDDVEATYGLATRVEMLLQILLERGYLGSRTTPLHNALRGLDDERSLALRDAIDLLIEEGVLYARASAVGVLISVSEQHQSLARRMANGETQIESLTQLFEEYGGA